MKRFIFLCIVVLIAQAALAQGWEWQSPLPPDVTLNSVYFVGPDTGWVVGSGGTIQRTTNAGGTWTAQSSGTTQALYGVCFVNGTSGYAVGTGGTIRRTTNSGATWTSPGSPTSMDLHGIAFMPGNPAVGFAAGNFGEILNTTNGGALWAGQNSGTFWDLQGVAAIGGRAFVVGLNGWILRTTNGGVFWSTPSSGTTNALNGASFGSSYNGWAVGEAGTIVRTTNTGTSWTIQSSGTTQSLRGASFVNMNTGWAVGDGGTILKTTNSGTAWTADSSGTANNLRAVFFVNVTTGWAVGAGGTILHYIGNPPGLTVVSPNGGELWNASDTLSIVWTSVNLPGDVALSLNRNFPSGEWETITGGIPNSGSYSWIVTGPAASAARMRILSVSSPSIGDSSDANFTIAAPLPPEHLVIHHSADANPANTGIVLIWNRTAGVNTTYNIYSDSTASGNFSQLVTSTSDTTVLIPAPIPDRAFYLVKTVWP